MKKEEKKRRSLEKISRRWQAAANSFWENFLKDPRTSVGAEKWMRLDRLYEKLGGYR